MHTLFLDANVLFAAAASETGASRALFALARRKKIKLVSSRYALQEAKVNIERKLHEKELVMFYTLISTFDTLFTGRIGEIDIQKYRALIVPKDVPILIGAVKLKADFLITLDRKDFFTSKLAQANLPYKILTPGKYLGEYL